MSKNSYCSKCGTKKVIKPTGDFNTKTGKPNKYETCPNIACDNNFYCPLHPDGKHKYGFFRNVCECGHRLPEYGDAWLIKYRKITRRH